MDGWMEVLFFFLFSKKKREGKGKRRGGEVKTYLT
jgi:hypothetical protein